MPSKKLAKKAITLESRPPASKSVKKYDHVEFLVVSETRVDHYTGSVIMRSKGKEMVLEVGGVKGPPYLLPGRITSWIQCHRESRSHGPLFLLLASARADLRCVTFRPYQVPIYPEMLKEPKPDGGTDPAMVSYKLTRFGYALIDYIGQQMGFHDETLKPLLEARLSEFETRRCRVTCAGGGISPCPRL